MHHRDMMPGEMIIVRNLVIYFFNELYVVHSVWLFFDDTCYFERRCCHMHRFDETVKPKMLSFHNTFSFTLRHVSA